MPLARESMEEGRGSVGEEERVKNRKLGRYIHVHKKLQACALQSGSLLYNIMYSICI